MSVDEEEEGEENKSVLTMVSTNAWNKFLGICAFILFKISHSDNFLWSRCFFCLLGTSIGCGPWSILSAFFSVRSRPPGPTQ